MKLEERGEESVGKRPWGREGWKVGNFHAILRLGVNEFKLKRNGIEDYKTKTHGE